MLEVREKPKMVERALLVAVQQPEDAPGQAQPLLAELKELVETLEISVVGSEVARVRNVQPRYLLGSGKAETIVALARELNCDCIVFDADLSPSQQRNWETLSKLCVIDRREVILDIFKQRATTREAVLQVELAMAEHSLPRLKNAWTHLSRQRGGGGVTQRGEGEAQIELDQRMVRHQIAKLKRELETVVKQRGIQRSRRNRVPIPTAAIVGYTNAGKSTLLNALTGASVLSEDKLFATLDPTTRQLLLPNGQKILLTDTVGFVRKLPHRLVEAFKATLEEAVVSEFLIHVIDATNPEMQAHYNTTVAVLKELGADEKRIITVYNKVDSEKVRNEIDRPQLPVSDAVFASALTGFGLEELKSRMEDILAQSRHTLELLIPHDRYDVINQLHQAGAIQHRESLEDGIHIVGRIPQRLIGRVEGFAIQA